MKRNEFGNFIIGVSYKFHFSYIKLTRDAERKRKSPEYVAARKARLKKEKLKVLVTKVRADSAKRKAIKRGF